MGLVVRSDICPQLETNFGGYFTRSPSESMIIAQDCKTSGPIIQLRKLRLRKVEQLAEYPPAIEWDLEPRTI